MLNFTGVQLTYFSADVCVISGDKEEHYLEEQLTQAFYTMLKTFFKKTIQFLYCLTSEEYPKTNRSMLKFGTTEAVSKEVQCDLEGEKRQYTESRRPFIGASRSAH